MQVKKGRAFQTKNDNTNQQQTDKNLALTNGLTKDSQNLPNGHAKGLGGFSKHNQQTNQWRTGFDVRAEPFWGFQILLDESIQSEKEVSRKRKNIKTPSTAHYQMGQRKEDNGCERTILLVEQKPKAPPTQLPMKIRRYDCN